MKPKPLLTPKERARLKTDLTAAFKWMRDSEQPAGAIISHHGIYLVKNRLPRKLSEVRLSPGGAQRDDILFIFSRTDRYPRDGDDYRPDELFSEDDLKQLRALIHGIARPGIIVDEWNGLGCLTVSMQTNIMPSPSVVETQRYYSSGCTDTSHGHGARTTLCGPWAKAGHERARFPKRNWA